MNRRKFLTNLSLLGLTPMLPSCVFNLDLNTNYTNNQDLPNVILITADDLGWLDLSGYGNTMVTTSNLDQLAFDGIKFSRAFGVTSTCSSSRASFMTGQYPHTHGLDGLVHRHPEKALSRQKPNLARILNANGYETAIWGKWHIAHPLAPAGLYGYNHQFGLPAYAEPDPNTIEQFIRSAADHRFYLELNYMDNHRDITNQLRPAKGFPVNPENVSVNDYMGLPNDIPELKVELANFYSQTLQMDDDIGKVLAVIDQLGLTDNTLIIFVSDNGAPFPGNKLTLYDRGIGTPLIVKWPEQILPNTQNGSLVSTIDILPTVLDACQIEVPAGREGVSLLPEIIGRSISREAVFAEMTHHVDYIPSRAVRTQQWKYIRNYSSKPIYTKSKKGNSWMDELYSRPGTAWLEPRPEEELYDLTNDPHEQTNLGNSRLDVKLEMAQLLNRHLADTNDPYLYKEFDGHL